MAGGGGGKVLKKTQESQEGHMQVVSMSTGKKNKQTSKTSPLGFPADGMMFVRPGKKISCSNPGSDRVEEGPTEGKTQHNDHTPLPLPLPFPPRLIHVMHKTLTLEQEKRVTVLTGFPFL